jgi:hypothetical protein
VVTADGYLGMANAGVSVTAQETSTLDFTLRRESPCLDVSPTALRERLRLGEQAVYMLTLFNSGAAPLVWQRVESGCLPLGTPWLSTVPVAGVVPADSAGWITVTWDTAPITFGVYRGLLCIESDDQLQPEVELPVLLDSGWVWRFPVVVRGWGP